MFVPVSFDILSPILPCSEFYDQSIQIWVFLVLKPGTSNVENDEKQEVEVEPDGEAKVAILELSKGLGHIGEASKEEGETANDKIGTNYSGNVSLQLISSRANKEEASGRAGNKNDPQKNCAALNKHAENETVENEADVETGNATKDT